MALQTIVSRNVDPLDSAVVTIGFMRGGSAFNVIPAEFILGGTVRAFRPAVRDLVEKRICEIAHGTAATFGATAEARYERGYPPTVNDATEAEFAAEVAAEVCGAAGVNRAHPPSMGGEDFSYFLNARPGAMLWLGNGTGEGGCYLHNPKYDFNDEAIPTGSSVFVRLAERFLAREGA
jgi:hippurate hydrolase